MKKLFLLFIFICLSNQLYANPIVLDCKGIETYLHETKTLIGLSHNNIIEIDLKKETINFLDSEGIEQLNRLKKSGLKIEISKVNSAEIKFNFSFYNNYTKEDILRLFTLNRYNGSLEELSYANNIIFAEHKSICRKTKALF